MRRHVSIRERCLPKVLQLCRNIISVIRARRKPRETFSTHFHRYHSERRESKKWNAIRNAITAALNCVRLTVSKALLQILFYLALPFSVFVSPLCGIFNFTEELGCVFSLSKKKRTETNKKRWKKKEGSNERENPGFSVRNATMLHGRRICTVLSANGTSTVRKLKFMALSTQKQEAVRSSIYVNIAAPF